MQRIARTFCSSASHNLRANGELRRPSPKLTSLARHPQHIRAFSPSCRIAQETNSKGVQAPEYLDEGERKVFDIVRDGLAPISLEVQDVSGGCGSMYALDIVSEKFKGLSVIKQHRLVNSILGDEIKKWHGVQLKTKAP